MWPTAIFWPLNPTVARLLLNQRLKLTSHESSWRWWIRHLHLKENLLLEAFGLILEVFPFSTDCPDSAAAWLARRLTGRLQRGKVNRRLDGQWQWRGTHPPARPAGSTPSSFPPYTRPHSLTSLETGLKVEQLGRGVWVGGGAMGLQLGVVGEGSPPPKNVTLLCPKIDILTCTRHQPGLHGGLLEPYQYKVYSSWYRCCHPKQMMP